MENSSTRVRDAVEQVRTQRHSFCFGIVWLGLPLSKWRVMAYPAFLAASIGPKALQVGSKNT